MMNEKKDPQETFVQKGILPAREEKRPWQRPTLIFLGKLGKLVQGWGKTGGADDSDPQGTAKQGVG